MAYRGDLIAVAVLVGSRRLMPHQLFLRHRVLALRQASKMFGSDLTLQPELSGKFALPLAMTLLPTAPVVGLLGRELPRMVRPCLAG